MIWTHEETFAIAKADCAACQGLGMRNGRGAERVPCNCSLRAIFRECYEKFQQCAAKEKSASTVNLEHIGAGTSSSRGVCFGRKTEEYIADFTLMTQRALTPADWQIFRFYYLLAADCKMCCSRLNMDRGTFYHAIYRIEAQLGRVFRETLPYGLYPLSSYFSSSARGARTTPALVPPPPANILRAPLRAVVESPVVDLPRAA